MVATAAVAPADPELRATAAMSARPRRPGGRFRPGALGQRDTRAAICAVVSVRVRRAPQLVRTQRQTRLIQYSGHRPPGRGRSRTQDGRRSCSFGHGCAARAAEIHGGL
ncbi:hypothetical protein HBB16_12480 [Pseudonocardia sp. MCCB 268]|nr:hypothetical protein [Pseudonocardia cytotoxica]